MSLFATPEEHAANPPETWEIRKLYERRWVLIVNKAHPVETQDMFPTKKDAEDARDNPDSWLRRLYDDETRWYKGEPVRGWRPYAEIKAAQERMRIRMNGENA